MLLFLWWFRRELPRFADDERARRAGFLAFALGSMALPYGLLFYSHAPAMACAGGAFLLALLARPMLAGLLAGAAVVFDYQSVLAAAVVGVYVGWRRPRDLVRFALGGAAPAVLLLYYHWAAFGSPLRTGYAFAADPAQKRGFLGVVGPNWKAFGQALVAPDNGLLFLAPWTVLAVVGVVAGRRRAETWVCAAAAVLYILFIGSTVPEFGRGGWSVGPRYIAAAVPFLAWLAARGLDVIEPRPVARTVGHAIILIGVFVHVVAATTYPHWPIAFHNPLFSGRRWRRRCWPRRSCSDTAGCPRPPRRTNGSSCGGSGSPKAGLRRPRRSPRAGRPILVREHRSRTDAFRPEGGCRPQAARYRPDRRIARLFRRRPHGTRPRELGCGDVHRARGYWPSWSLRHRSTA